ncbi:MAG: methyl-accepting chemotaxis protein [Myxococcaceae bacterium]
MWVRSQGRGFSIVAQEMRNLAEGSKRAAAEVHGILRELQEGIAKTVTDSEEGQDRAVSGDALAQRCAEQIHEFSQTMITAVASVGQLSTVSTQQNDAMQEPTRAVESARAESVRQEIAATEVRNISVKLVPALRRSPPDAVADAVDEICVDLKLPEEAAPVLSSEREARLCYRSR